MDNHLKVRTGYEAVFPDGKTVFVDPQDMHEVCYLFNVYLCNPNVKIYVCWNDGSKREVVLV